MKTTRAFVIVGVLAIGMAHFAVRAESGTELPSGDPPRQSSPSALRPGFRWIFNGRDLKGWHKNPKPIGHGTGGQWTVNGGAITGQQDPPGSGNGGILLTDEEFGDFEASLEVHIDWGCDSGLFVRSTEQGQCYQVMIDYHDNGNMGEIYREGLDGATNRTYRLDGVYSDDGKTALKEIKVTPLTTGDARPSLTQDEFTKLWKMEDWNTIRVRVAGNPPTITTWLNGRRITQYTSEKTFEGTLGARGRLAVQVHGGAGLWPKGAKVQYRNIQIKELNAAPAASQPATLPASRACSPQGADAGKTVLDGRPLDYKVGFLGIPSSRTQFEMTIPVPWTRETIGRLKELGFNTVQLNVAWGRRPGDEPLNLEDVVQLSPEQDREFPQVVPLRCLPGAEARDRRRAELRRRIALCREAGLRTIFHFGAPYNAHGRYGDGPPNCLMDGKVTQRYELLLDVFAREFPGIDDILVYTYDQDAWLCSEFGPCPRCLGIPLHDRLAPFLDRLTARWRSHSAQGRLWWEPWELSAGQVLACVERAEPRGFGLALHCNIAEVMSTLPVDRWLKNTAAVACRREIPVTVEYFLGGPSEEVENLYNLAYPLVTLRGLKAIASVPGVVGIKEYYGLNPAREDPNLRMTGLFFKNPGISEGEALKALAEPYGQSAGDVIAFWQRASEAMELFPWETSWFIREIGRSRTDHALSAAMLRGQQAHTPSWCSTRHAIFMKTDNAAVDPWMLEDVQLRCQLAADRWAEALSLGQRCRPTVPAALGEDFAATLVDVGRVRRRALAYVFHLRETNLATVLRKAAALKQPLPQKAVDELLALLKTDLENHRAEMAALPPGQDKVDWKEMEAAIALLQQNPDEFLQKYFQEDVNKMSKGSFSVTSR